MEQLLEEIRGCTICADHLPLGPRPIVEGSRTCKLLIVGQAPGSRVHQTGIPWNDPSGRQLREWLQLDEQQFYDSSKVAIVPMGFCYPGSGKSGDLPPRPECQEAWHQKVLGELANVELTLLIGNYAQKAYLGSEVKINLTETVRNFESYLPDYLPLPHPSPRNRIWLKKNGWFSEEVLPILRSRVRAIF